MTRLRDDLGFLFMVLRVEHVVRDALFFEHLRQQLRFFNGDRAHQHGLLAVVALAHLPDDGAEFCRLGLIHHVRVVLSDDGAVRGDLHNIQIVNAGELFFLRERGAGHAGELGIKTEEILERDGG